MKLLTGPFVAALALLIVAFLVGLTIFTVIAKSLQ